MTTNSQKFFNFMYCKVNKYQSLSTNRKDMYSAITFLGQTQIYTQASWLKERVMADKWIDRYTSLHSQQLLMEFEEICHEKQEST